MRKILFFLLASFSLVFAIERPDARDLDACYQRNVDSQFTYKNLIAVSLTRHLAAVIPDKDKPLKPGEFIKFDPYIGLYLVEVDTTESAPYLADELRTKNDTWVNVLDPKVSKIGHIKHFSEQLGVLDELNFVPDKKGMLLCDCCQMLGIATGDNKFVGNRYLRNFIAYKDVYYGDIGVTFDKVEGEFYVKSVNARAIGKDLRPGDKILSINGIVPRNLREVNEAVLFAPKGNTINYEILRSGKKMIFHIKMPNNSIKEMSKDKKLDKILSSVKAVSKSANDDKTKKSENKKLDNVKSKVKKQTITKKAKRKENAVLDSYGLKVAPNLIVTGVSKSAKKFGFKKGDLIMQVGRKKVSSLKDLNVMLNNNDLNHVLVSRKDFQFFIRLQR